MRDRSSTCRNCGREYADGTLDTQRWCESCRGEVIRRASLWARVAALLAALAVGAWIVLGIRPERTPVVIWMVLLGATYLFVSKLVRRIAFEIIRGRGVPPLQD